MNLLNYRVSEKVITVAVIVSLLMNTTTPVFADSETEENATPVVIQTPVVPVEEELPAKAVRFITVTAYSSDVWQNDSTPFLPANGIDYRKVYAEKGDVRCIALNDLPLGSLVRFKDERVTSIYGDKPVEVCDRKHEKYNGRWSADMYTQVGIDGKIDSKESLDAARKIAKQFGVKRQVKMEILTYGKPKVKAAPKVTVVNQSTNTVTMK